MKNFLGGAVFGFAVAVGTTYALGKISSKEESKPEGEDKKMDDRFKELNKTIDKTFNTLSSGIDKLAEELKKKFGGGEEE